MNRKVLVTGGLGYLGGRIAQALSMLARTRVVLTSRTPGSAPPIPFEVDGVVELDLSGPIPDKLCEGVTDIIHLAAANEIVSARRPAAAIDITTRGTQALVEHAVATGVQRFIYLSTVHVYGSPVAGHLTEQTLPRPRHPYAITHRAAEDFVLAAAEAGHLNAAVVRLSNAFGPPVWPTVDRWTLLANDLCRQAVAKGVLTLHSAGEQERDFICMTDAVRGVLHLLRLDPAQLGDGLFNLGGRRAMRVIELARMIQDRADAVLGARPDLQVGSRRAGQAEAPPLRFDSARIASTGFTWTGSPELEIDGTLRLCQAAFGAAP